MEIDGVDIESVSRLRVRQAVNLIPQEEVFLTGSVRSNLYSLGRANLPDSALIDALSKVKLWQFVRERGGLDAELDAKKLSRGQRQLFALATALLRLPKIVVIDEATSR